MEKLTFVIFGSISLAVVAIIALYFPEQYGELSLWLKTFWILFLVFINWLASSLILFKVGGNTRSPAFGVLPGINIAVFFYSMFSVGALINNWDTPTSSSHIILQIISGTICVVIVLLSTISAKTAEIPSIPEGVYSKEELIRRIKKIEAQFPGEDALNFTEVREVLQYSTPHNSKLALLPEFSILCELTNTLEKEGHLEERRKELAEQMKLAARNCC